MTAADDLALYPTSWDTHCGMAAGNLVFHPTSCDIGHRPGLWSWPVFCWPPGVSAVSSGGAYGQAVLDAPAQPLRRALAIQPAMRHRSLALEGHQQQLKAREKHP